VHDVLIGVVLRVGLNRMRIRRYAVSPAKTLAEKRALIDKFIRSPIAIRTDVPNVQHYEVPSELFQLVLVKWLKYSYCYWPADFYSLEEVEVTMLVLTYRRARLEDGMRVLGLGCGWGSLSLWIATNFPNCQVLAVSN
jgi:cyclopropane-fatty-acyl-phospholipid synthase